jgi:hypothetical protein
MVNIKSVGHVHGGMMAKFPSFDSNKRIKKKVALLFSKACVMNWATKWAETGLPCRLG